MFTSAYTLGRYKGLKSLGLEKFAMMLPPPTAVSRAVGAQAGRGGVQSVGNSVAGGLAAKETSPVMQQIAAMGPSNPAASETSKWIRGGLLQEAPMEDMLAGIRAAQPQGKMRAPATPRGSAPTQIPTMAPTVRP